MPDLIFRRATEADVPVIVRGALVDDDALVPIVGHGTESGAVAMSVTVWTSRPRQVWV